MLKNLFALLNSAQPDDALFSLRVFAMCPQRIRTYLNHNEMEKPVYAHAFEVILTKHFLCLHPTEISSVPAYRKEVWFVYYALRALAVGDELSMLHGALSQCPSREVFVRCTLFLDPDVSPSAEWTAHAMAVWKAFLCGFSVQHRHSIHMLVDAFLKQNCDLCFVPATLKWLTLYLHRERVPDSLVLDFVRLLEYCLEVLSYEGIANTTQTNLTESLACFLHELAVFLLMSSSNHPQTCGDECYLQLLSLLCHVHHFVFVDEEVVQEYSGTFKSSVLCAFHYASSPHPPHQELKVQQGLVTQLWCVVITDSRFCLRQWEVLLNKIVLCD
eukprot:PhF_6_TR39634/c0_g1_i3/m.58738